MESVQLFKSANVVWICFLLFLSSSVHCFASATPVPGFVVLIDVKLSDSTPNIEKVVLRQGALHAKRLQSTEDNPLGYRLVVLDQAGSSLYEMEFYFPLSITIPPASPEGPEDQIPSVIPLDNPEITLIVPYFEDSDTILITNGGNSNPAAIKTLNGADLMAGLDVSSTPQPAPAEPGKMNLLIIASGYDSGSVASFRSQAALIKNTVLESAPFNTQVSAVNVHIFENTNDLECNTGCYGIDRLLCCNPSKVMSAASTSGFLFDEVIVVHNTPTYAGGGYREYMDAYKTNSYSTFSAVYDGYYTGVMALHEFGHSFGNLCDEYSYGSEGYTYSPCVNCIADCSQFPTVTACQLGCDAKPDYYRPGNSVMYSLSYSSFNDASVLTDASPDGLKKRLNFFVGELVKGDVNGDTVVDLHDVVMALQILSGIVPQGAIHATADVNGDGKIGMAEVIYAIRNADQNGSE